MKFKASVAIDVLIRNLFERTADIGFLATDNDIRINIIDDIDIDISERKNLRIDLYWKLLIEYHWFYNYFQRMIA